MNLLEWHMSGNEKFPFSLMQPGTLVQYANKTDLLQKDLNRHNHNRKDFNLQALLCGKQLLKQACSMQINQIFHATLTDYIHKGKSRYKHPQSLGRFKARVSTHIFGWWNKFSTIRKCVVLVLPKKHVPWQHHYGVELTLVRLMVPSTHAHS